jgi:hypothetical protein
MPWTLLTRARLRSAYLSSTMRSCPSRNL